MRDTSLDKTDLPAVGYYWVPASTDDASFGMYSLTKLTSTTDEVKFKAFEFQGRLAKGFQYPDRKIFISTQPFPRTMEGKHQDLSLRYQFSRTPFILYNAFDAPKKTHSTLRDELRGISHVIQDSGGFQLAVDRTDFIDPVGLAALHSEYADSGVSLDLPLHGIGDERLIKASARMLVANSAVLRAHTHKSVRLLNVCHGSTLSLRKKYLDYVMEEPLDAMCIAGLRPKIHHSSTNYYIDPLRFTAHVLYVIFRTRNVYEHYHVLGVSGMWQIALLALIAERTGKVVTSDSTSHRLGGKSGIVNLYANQANFRVPRKSNDLRTVCCGCPACKVAHYEYTLAHYAQLATAHTLFKFVEFAASMNQLARMGAYADISHNIHGYETWKPKFSHKFQRALRLIQDARSTKDLHADEFVEKPNNLFKDASSELSTRLLKVVHRYEDYHGTKFYS